jgi:uncharacterized protein
MRSIGLALALVTATPAFAQSGPSFECGRASSPVERAICADPQLAMADREMAGAYDRLAARLSGPARQALVEDQLRWIADRNRACATDTDGIVPCLRSLYGARRDNLVAFADGAYPFISQHALIGSGTLGRIAWSYDIAYPRFDGDTADFGAVNRRYADAAAKAAAEATPKPDAGIDRKQQWTYQQSFTISRPNARAVTVAVQFYGFSGGAHGYGATRCALVDLQSGAAVDVAAVFAPGDQWLTRLTAWVAEDLAQQFVSKPGFDEALKPANLRKMLRETDRYCWRADRLELIFNAYDVGPYAAGPYRVELPYDRLKPLLAADGPI